MTQAQQKKRLYLSLRDGPGVESLPEGLFRHRRVPTSEAVLIINGAFAEKRCICVSNTDLLAPYKRRELERAQELCKLLREHLGVAIDINRFFHGTADDAGNETIYSVLPLQCIVLGRGDAMITVTGHYERVGKGMDFKLLPESIEFHEIGVAEAWAE